MEKIKVTVIIPVYNVENYLRYCLDSVLGQTLKELEVICIDDASPDHCPQILDEYAARDERVRVIHLPENHRQGYGRDLGLERASGKYVYLLDPDDLITENALAELYERAERERTDGIIFDYRVIYDSDGLARKFAHFRYERHHDYAGKIWNGKELFDLMCQKDDWNVFIQRQFWRTAFLRDNGIVFPVDCEHEDEEFSFKALILAERVSYVNEPYFIRRVRADSVMTKAIAPRNYYGYLQIYDDLVGFVREKELSGPAVEITLGRILDHVLRYHHELKDRYDLYAGLKNAELKHLFDLLDQAYKGRTFYRNCLARQPELKRYRKVYLYGAGVVAAKYYQGLVDEGYVVEGFIISQRGKEPEVLQGRPVYTVDQIGKIEDDAVILIATTSGYWEAISATLQEKGLPYLTIDNK